MTHSPAPPRRVLTLREGTETLPPVRVRATADPDADHARIRELAMYLSPGPVAGAATFRSIELADLTLALDAHLAGGGPLPAAWQPAGTAPAAAAYLRAYLTACRAERDWIRAAVRSLESRGLLVVSGGVHADPGTRWTITDWRTCRVLAHGLGGQQELERAHHDDWADINWAGLWLDRALSGDPSLRPGDWPEYLPPAASTADPEYPGLPGLPDSLASRWLGIAEDWATNSTDPGRPSEVAALAGWTADQVRACTASYVTTPGNEFMRLGEA